MTASHSIKIKKRSDATDPNRPFRLVVDGESFDPDDVSISGAGANDLSVYIRTAGVQEKLKNFSIADFPWRVSSVSVLHVPARPNMWIWTVLERYASERKIRVRFLFVFLTNDWDQPWSLRSYREAVKTNVAARSSAGISWFNEEERFLEGILVRDVEPASLSIADVTNKWFSLVAEVVHDSVARMDSSTAAEWVDQKDDSLELHFDFPPHIQAACEQYLVYFVQFLRELGVEATADLTHQATHALFSIAPRDRGQALDNIRRALEVYLQLPENPGIDLLASHSRDVRLQQLAGVVQHYRSQLNFAQATVQLKEATIQAQRGIIEQQANMLSTANVLLESITYVSQSGEREDREEFLGGIVAIGKYEDKGVTVNWAQAFRELRRLFSKKED